MQPHGFFIYSQKENIIFAVEGTSIWMVHPMDYGHALGDVVIERESPVDL